MKKVVIVGGGISGLTCAYALKEKARDDIEVLLVEEEKRLGGQIITERVDGFVVEGGPDCVLSTKPWAIELSKKLGIEDRIINTNQKNRGTYVFSRGKLHLLPEGMLYLVPTKFSSFITSTLISWPGKIRMGLEIFVPRRRSRSDESLADFVRRRLGREALEKIAEPLIGGIHASNPEKMSLEATFPQLIKMEQDCGGLIRATLVARRKMGKAKEESKGKGRRRTFFVSFVDGMQELVDALAKMLDKRTVLLGTKVSKIERRQDQQSGPKYKLYLEGQRTGEIKADAVILSTLSHVTADTIQDTDSSLADLLRTISCVSSVTVSVAFEESCLKHPLNGFGFVVPHVERRRIMACTWSSAKWSHRAPRGYVLLRCFIGGIYGQNFINLDDDAIKKMVLEELKDIMGIDKEPVLTKIYRWRHAMPQYTVNHLRRFAEIKQRLANHPGLFVTGASYQGVGVPDCVHSASLLAEDVSAFLEKKQGN